MSVGRLRVQRRESLKRCREGRMIPPDLRYQMAFWICRLVAGGLVLVVLWPRIEWLAVLLTAWWLLETWTFALIVSQLIRGRHQSLFQERAVCRQCGKVALPHRMKPHQIEPHECHGAWTVVPLSALTPPPAH